jgi:uncharacterized membrane protein
VARSKMRLTGFALVFFAVGLAGLGVLSLICGDFAMVWQPVPKGLPWREGFARISGLVLLAGGVGMVVKRTAAPSAIAMTLYLVSWLLLLQVPRVVARPAVEAMWSGCGENLMLIAGGWMLFVSLRDRDGSRRVRLPFGLDARRAGQVLFGASLPLVGVSHFVYVAATAEMVPSWLPGRELLAYLTGAGHVAAGLALMLGVLPRLAATMEAIMLSSFVVLIHVPDVVAEPTSRLPWTMLCVASALTAAGWAVAGSLVRSPWGLAPRAARAEPSPG